jgi:hypothetical protein
MIPFIIGGLAAAVGFVAGAFTSHAAGEGDREKAKHYKAINNDLIKKRDDLEKRYIELEDKSNETVSELERKLLESEIEKDSLYLVVRLQNSLLLLQQAIDRDPSFEVLLNFQQAVIQTNLVLHELGEDTIPLPKDYFSRNLIKAKIKLVQQHLTPTAEQLLVLKRIMPVVSDGAIDCPYCGELNAVMKKTASMPCGHCGEVIDLISEQDNIYWNHQQSCLPAYQAAGKRQLGQVA